MIKKSMGTLFVFFMALAVLAQQRDITGTVTDASDGSTLPGVNITVKGTSLGVVTDVDGKYSISVTDNNAVLEFSFVGYAIQDVPVGSRSVIDVKLVSEATGLEEVVVTALGIKREKKSLGYTVTELKADDISSARETNPINALSGKVAGLTITRASGGPGSSSRVIIRGNNSLGGNNQPLYVIDGIPMDNTGQGSVSGTGTAEWNKSDYGSGISDINPDDIESMSVLKGPNAAALYGSRAANGVILITTKKGKSGKGVGVTYSTNITFDTPFLFPEFQNEYGQGDLGVAYTELDRVRSSTSSWGPKMDGSEYLYWTGESKAFLPQKDNIKDFFETGHNINHTVVLEGGNENTNARFSYTNNYNSAIIPNSYVESNSFNLRVFSKLTKKFTLDAKGTFYMQDAKNRIMQGSNYDNPVDQLYTIPRNIPLSDIEDYRNDDLSVRSWAQSTQNPFWTINANKFTDKRIRFLGFVKTTYQFTDYLSAFARIGTDYTNHKIKNIYPTGHIFYTGGRMTYSNPEVMETNADYLIMFNKKVNDFSITANLGGNLRFRTNNSSYFAGENFKVPVDGKYYIENTKKDDWSIGDGTEPTEKEVRSIYATTSVGYKDMMYIDLSYRQDVSSTLPSDNAKYDYYSFSYSAIITEILEKGFNIDYNKDIFSFAKLRAGYSEVGNDTGPYQLLSGYRVSSNGYLGTTTVSRDNVLRNPDLKAETTKSFELGLELRLLKNRIYADMSYYDIKTVDQLIRVPLSAGAYSSFMTNSGTVINKGFEISLGGKILDYKDLTWEATLNYAQNTNELEELYEEGDQKLEEFIFSELNSGNVVVKAIPDGGAFGGIYTTSYKVVNDVNSKYYGHRIVNDKGGFVSDPELRKIGDYQPDWTGGLINVINYKGVELRFQIDARIGGDLYNSSQASLDGAGVSDKTLEGRENGIKVDNIVEEILEDGKVVGYKPFTENVKAQYYWGSLPNSEYVEDATNIRLREVTLSYNIPKNLLSKTKFLKSASIGFSARNLLFLYNNIEGYDPESSYSVSNFGQGLLYSNMPTIRSYSINCKITF